MPVPCPATAESFGNAARPALIRAHPLYLIVASLVCLASGVEAAEAEHAYRDRIVPFFRSHCSDCHGEFEAEANLTLPAWKDEQTALEDKKNWQRIRRVLSRREMPPADHDQPPPEERTRLIAWIDAEVFGIDCSRPQPGKVTIRRLNRQEYRNTIRDLLGVEVSIDNFPVDPSGHGFDNIGDVLTVPPVLVERYLAAAERALDEAIVTPEDRRSSTKRFPLDLLEIGYNAKPQGNGLVALTSVEEDDLVAFHRVPIAGEYTLSVRAYAEQRGDRPLELTFLLNEDPLKTLLIANKTPADYVVSFRAPRGKQRFRVAMRRLKDGLSPEKALEWKNGPTQNGTIFVEWLEVEGPRNVQDEDLPRSHRAIFAAADDIKDRQQAARQILSNFVPRAYRRPVDPGDIEPLLALCESSWDRGESFESGIKTALTAVLVSPRFLYRPEVLSSLAATKDVTCLDQFALASRLSYFLWSSMPDEELVAVAREGTLHRNLERQVRRMLADPKAAALVKDFAGQWLELRNLELVTPDPKQFPFFDAVLREAMRLETEHLFEFIRKEDRPLTELVSADYTFVNERLAEHYGVEGVKGTDFQRVSLIKTPRRGILGHASILTLTSNPTRTSPVKRGKWVLENLLAAPPPPPPPDVPELDNAPTIDPSLSLRKRLEQHRQDATCASCHRRMDGIGFALEHFDATGQWRENDGAAQIDATGELFGGKQFDGAIELANVLAGAEQDQLLRCIAEKMLTYALGRGLEVYDTCAIDRIVARAQKEGGRFSSMMLGVVESDVFQYVQRSAADASAEGKPPEEN